MLLGAVDANVVLIPLNSGLAWSRTPDGNTARDGRLNPFEFRAGLEPPECEIRKRKNGLNPFEFRAGLEPVAAVDSLYNSS